MSKEERPHKANRGLTRAHTVGGGKPPIVHRARESAGHHQKKRVHEHHEGSPSLSHGHAGARTKSKTSVLGDPSLDDTSLCVDHNLITVGICAMNKKTLAQPMKNILQQLTRQVHIQVIIFSDDTILSKAVEEWPICECLIAFYSYGFPLDKAIEYVKLRKPMVINNLETQYELMDRCRVYEILAENGIDVPRYVVLDRDTAKDTLVETDDTIEIRGEVFHKPFVEKPVSAEDHNIYIYFPSDFGGGSQRLFRKINDRSSCYSKESSVRKTGSYIYEEFLATDGTDVKVYTVGPDYAHAEARKSPALDGKVERDAVGKEKRYPVILTAAEKLIARKVCLAFKQTVCGFDMLRANGKSYVCDVNGFSFVKKSQKYYEDCSQILMEMIMTELAPHVIPHIPPSVEYMAEDAPVPIPRLSNQLELRCVIGIIRHGDRTPKQKMKMLVKHRKFFELFETLNGYKTGQLKIKKPKLLQKVLDISRYLLDNVEKYHESHEIEEKVHKLQQLKAVLEMYGHFSGINRKVQFKLLTKPGSRQEPLLLLILKWGGELTPAGQVQAEELGRAFRCMYPGGEGEYASLPGSGFLRLHSTYRHDLKVYASDEGRVQMTAAAFTRGLLDLEGNLASILVHLVKRDQNATNMLDTSTDASESLMAVKERLHSLLHTDAVLNEEYYPKLAPTGAESLVNALKHIHNPREMCERLYAEIRMLVGHIKAHIDKRTDVKLYHAETLHMMLHRWEKLEKDFKDKSGRFDISKIPDIYDCIKYDMIHNSTLHLSNATELLRSVIYLADVVIPQEYGMTREEKVDIGLKVCTPILRKIQADLQHTIVNEHSDVIHRLDPHHPHHGVVTPNRHVRTRLYFTSESHVHTMLNIFRHGCLFEHLDNSLWLEALRKLSATPELNYMTQIVLMLFEDTLQPEGSERRYQVDLHFSPGMKGREELLKGKPSSTNVKLSPDLLAKPIQSVKRLVFEQFTEGILRPEKQLHSIMKQRVPIPILKSASEGQLGQKSRQNSTPTSPIIIHQHRTASESDTGSLSDLYSSSTSVLDRGYEIIENDDNATDSEPGFQFVVGSTSPPKKSLKELASFGKVVERALPEDNPEIGGLTLAAELSSTVEPLAHLCSVSLYDMNSSLNKWTGMSENYRQVSVSRAASGIYS